jgi:transposase
VSVVAEPVEDELVTTAQAAALVDRSAATIRSWIHREALTVAGQVPTPGGGAPTNVFRRQDVLAAAAASNAHGARKPPSRQVAGSRWDPTGRLLTQQEAAASVGVDVRTVRGWVQRGYLVPHTVAGSRRPLYLESQVLDAERCARRADRRYRAKG